MKSQLMKVEASSNEGDVVLDPFCSCGTTIAAAQKLGRTWIGIDVTHLAVGLMKLRLKDSFGMLPTLHKPAREQGRNTQVADIALAKARARAPDPPTYRVIGQPEDLGGAKELALNDRDGLQWWILPLMGARALVPRKAAK